MHSLHPPLSESRSQYICADGCKTQQLLFFLSLYALLSCIYSFIFLKANKIRQGLSSSH